MALAGVALGLLGAGVMGRVLRSLVARGLIGPLDAVCYAAVGGPNQVVSASASPTWDTSPTQAT